MKLSKISKKMWGQALAIGIAIGIGAGVAKTRLNSL
jgi:hypothetical protein